MTTEIYRTVRMTDEQVEAEFQTRLKDEIPAGYVAWGPYTHQPLLRAPDGIAWLERELYAQPDLIFVRLKDHSRFVQGYIPEGADSDEFTEISMPVLEAPRPEPVMRKFGLATIHRLGGK